MLKWLVKQDDYGVVVVSRFLRSPFFLWSFEIVTHRHNETVEFKVIKWWDIQDCL